MHISLIEDYKNKRGEEIAYWPRQSPMCCIRGVTDLCLKVTSKSTL
jgi:hypothetical protein